MADILPFGKKPDLPKYPPKDYRIEAKGDHAEVVLYGVVGDPFDGISAKQVFEDLRKVESAKTLSIHINSPGGFVTEGVAIANRIRAHKARKTVHVDGEASSIASYIAMVGDEIVMGEGSLMLVHRPWTFVIGNEDDMERALRDLRTVQKDIVAAYAARTKMKPDAVLSLMAEDRYMDAAEAVDLGFADRAVSGTRMAALAVDRGALRLPDLPKQTAALKARMAAAAAKIRAATSPR
ncbi:MAG: head maturation protease, ClpP-related [Alphaproteobacteria bacterium]